MRRHRQAVLFGAAVIASLGGARGALAETVDFRLDSHSVAVERAALTATFTLTFNQPPNFVAAPGETQVNAFQYEIDAGWSEPPAGAPDTGTVDFNSISTVIRGAEISGGSGLPIRDRDGAGGASAGGWGAVRELVPFEVQDQTLTFTTPLDSLGDSDGVFRYRLFTTDRGLLTSEANGVAIPLPPAVAAGALTLGAAALARRLRGKFR